MTEGKLWLKLVLFGPTVANIYTFFIFEVDVLRTISALNARVCVKTVCTNIVERCREGERQLARRVHCAEEHIGNGVAGFGAEIPCLHNGVHIICPWHSHSVARNVHHHQIRIGLGKSFDNCILSVWQFQAGAVAILAILVLAFVQASNKHHTVGLAGLIDGFGNELLGRAAFIQVLASGHAIVFAGYVAYIATHIFHFGPASHHGFDSIERKHFALNLQRRAAASHCHHLYGILAHHEYALNLVKADWQHRGVVLQQHDALVANAARSGIVFVAAKAAERAIAVHRCAENQTKHTASLVVEFLSAHFARMKEFKIWVGKEIAVVGILLAQFQPVCPAAVFQVETVGYGLVGVVGTAPVAHHHSVESPFVLQDIVEDILVVAQVLVAIQVVGTHNGPSLCLGNCGLECRQVNLIESTVVDNHVGGVAVHLVVVKGKVLHTGSHAVLLHPLDVRHHHRCRQIRVLAHIFKVAAVERSAVDVNSWAQQHSLVAIAGFFAYRFAV